MKKAEMFELQRVSEFRRILNLAETPDELIRPIDAIEPMKDEYLRSLTYVFGGAFLCATSDIAQQVSQHPKVKGYAITAEGDQFNPAGSISGGSLAGLGGLLLNFQKYKKTQERMAALQQSIAKLKALCNQLSVQAKKSTDLRLEAQKLHIIATEFEVSQLRAVGLLNVADLVGRKEDLLCTQKRLAEGADSGGNEKKETDLRVKLKESECQLLGVEEQLERIETVEIPGLRKQIHDAEKTSLENRLKKLEAERRRLRQQLESSVKIFDAISEKTRSVTQEVAVLGEQLETLQVQRRAKEQELSAAEIAQKTAEDEVAKATAAVEKATKLMNDAQSTVDARANKVDELKREQRATEQRIVDFDVEITKAERTMRSLKQQIKDVQKRIEYILRDNIWIESVEAEYNVPGGRYDFTTVRNADCFAKLEKLRQQADTLRKKVDKNILATVDAAEAKLCALEEKRQHLVRDRRKLEQFIEELDVKKREVLLTCREQVTQNFTAIFNLLLPGAKATLTPVPAKQETEQLQDLEIKVTLNKIKQASLSELSGGQRSLLALSLVLALLQYKPAPLYILDEVDAALDLSHTQRIGKLIKQFFQNSQFIVISLKENLFNYADVLFKTEFSEGSSRVKRFDNTKANEEPPKENIMPTKGRKKLAIAADIAT